MAEDMFSDSLAEDVKQLRRSLRQVIREAQESLDRLDQGQRPALTMTVSSPVDTRDVDKYAARVDMILNWAGSPFLPEAAAIEALKQQ